MSSIDTARSAPRLAGLALRAIHAAESASADSDGLILTKKGWEHHRAVLLGLGPKRAGKHTLLAAFRALPFRALRLIRRPGRARRCRPYQGADCRW